MKKTPKEIQRFYSLFTALLLLFSSLKAADKPIRVVAAPALEGSAAGINSSQVVSILPPAGTTEFDQVNTGMIKLRVLPNKVMNYMPTHMNLNVTIEVKIYDHTSTTAPYHTANYVLSVDYAPFSSAQTPYKDQDYLLFSGAGFPEVYKIDAKIIDIVVNSSHVSQLPANIGIETSIDYLRYQSFGMTGPTYPSIVAKNLDCNGTVDEVIEVSWTPPVGTTYSELEYTVINDYLAGGGSKSSSQCQADVDFKHNSTRVVTKNNFYQIPNIFDKGLFACQIRCYGRTFNTTTHVLYPEIAGPWVYKDGMLGSHFQKDLNWQYNATFAEEGKYKVILNYADGSGRSRQTITQNNSDRTTIVGQTIYDFTGRPAVTILPAPLTDPYPGCATSNAQNSFIYRPNLNYSTGSLPFSKYHIDLDQSGGSCLSVNQPLVSTAGDGAGVYYSTNNTNKNGQQAFVPDAGGYPYSQVEYTGDNTGRIKRQGGVGAEFQLGQGHETKFYYGAPEQIELDRLFGSEVGDASHYQKNMTVDGNGQVSVTYLDMNGKTVATALSGNAPVNLDNLSTIPPVGVLRADMFNKNAKGKSQVNLLNADGDALVFNKSILVTTMNSVNVFTYNISVDTLKLQCMPNVCLNCVYDYELKITDDCGYQVYPNPAVNGKVMLGNFSVVNSDTIFTVNCNAPGVSPTTVYSPTITTPPLTLNPGVYYVSKTLRVNKDARDIYLQAYLAKATNTCISDLSDFETTELNKIQDSTDCAITCANCFTKLGTKDSYVAKGKGTEQQWDAMYQQCKDLCQFAKTSCDIYLNQLLMDVSPNGQYGAWTNPSDPLSVYNPQNLLPKNVTSATLPGPMTANMNAYWKKPKYSSNQAPHYYDQNGLVAVVKLSKVPNGPYSNAGNYNLAVDNLALTFTPSPNTYYTYPENLTKVSDFVARWQPSWAKSLVYMHPEYCYYQDCPNKFGATYGTSTLTSNDFDATLSSINTFSDALNKGLVSAVSGGGYAFNLSADPANVNGYFGPAYPQGSQPTPIIDVYSVYNIAYGPLAMHEYVAYLVKCSNQIGVNQTNNVNCTKFCATADNAILKNTQWNTLKSLYLAEKSKIAANYSDKMRFEAVNANCSYYNGCIGNTVFNAYSSPMIEYDVNNNYLVKPSSKYFKADQPCNMTMKDLYAHKVKRFGNVNMPSPIDQSEAEYQLYLQTGKCPNALDLQNLADAIAKNFKLKNPIVNSVAVPEPLQNYPQLTLNLYNYFNNLPTPPTNYVNYLWTTSIVGANDLKVNIKNSYNNTVAKTITFHDLAGSTINWSQVSRITQLKYTTTVGAIYNFTCIAKEQTGSTFVYKSISGETDIELTGCMFKDVCKPNDLATQLQSLMSALKANPSPGNSAMFSAAVTQMGATSAYGLYSNSLLKVQQTIGGTSTTNFAWKKTGNYSFEIYDFTSPINCKIAINFLSMSPTALSPGIFSSIVSFSNIKSDYQNFFTMEARGVNNILIGTIKGEIFKVCDGVGTHEGLSMGDCGKPDPAECKTQYHQNKKDLEVLIKDILLNQKYTGGTGSSNVMANPNLNNNLISSFTPMAPTIPATKYAVSNTYYRYLGLEFIPSSPNVQNDSIAFTFKSPCIPYGDGGGDPTGRYSGGNTNGIPGVDCEETIYCTVWFKTNYKTNPPSAGFGLANIISVDGIVGHGNTTSSGSYQDFYILVKYPGNQGTGGVPRSDTLYGSSCFEIQNCTSCGANQPVCCGGGSSGLGSRTSGNGQGTSSVDQSSGRLTGQSTNALVSNSKIYTEYKTAVSDLNKRMGWAENDSNFIRPVSVSQLMSMDYVDASPFYLEFISAFDPKTDNRFYLKDVPAFLRNHPNLKSPEYAYLRYKNAVSLYNKKANTLNLNNIEPVSDSLFNQNKCSRNISTYLDYLYNLVPSKDSTVLTPVKFTASQSTSRLSGATTSASQLTRCDSLYQEYTAAYNYFISVNTTCQPPPLFYPQAAFVQRNYCCPAPGYGYFAQYVSSFYSATICPQPIVTLPCVTPNAIDCNTLYQNYLSALDIFNTSAYAVNNNYILANPFISQATFNDQGYCNCANDYVNYLNTYISSNPKGSLPPASIKEFSGCGNVNFCEKEYNNYVTATTNYFNFISHQGNSGYPFIPLMYSSSMFTKNGFCYCADAYNAFLNGIMNGAVTDMDYINDHIDIATFCTPVTLDCAQSSPLDTITSPNYPGTAQDPCTKFKKETAKINAKLLYGQYVEAQAALFVSQYNAHCLNVVENLFRDYDDKEFHYTLYYYDQAGNLIKTIPPAGLDQTFYSSIKKYSDANAIKVRNDRSGKGKSVIVDHALATNYVYNSLNQLIRQKVPDHDAISSPNFKYNYSMGADTACGMVSSQMIEQKGYMAGNEVLMNTYFPSNLIRGKVFESNDACDNWQRIGNVSGIDLKKVQLVQTTAGPVYGFAVGSDGGFMISIDGGSNWDSYPLHELTYGNTLNDIKVNVNTTNQNMEGVIVGDSGVIIKMLLSPSTAPAFSSFTLNLPLNATSKITDVAAKNVSGATFEYYITILNKTDSSTTIYSCTSGGTSWTDITGTRLLDLTKVVFVKNTSHCYAAGKDGTLAKSTDNGLTWYLKKTGSTGNFKDIFFATTDIGVAVIEDVLSGIGSLYKTTDGGRRWSLLDQTAGMDYKSLSPYALSGNVNYVTANGLNGLVKRVTIDFSVSGSPAIGAVTTSISAAATQQIKDVAIVPYSNGTKQLAFAIGQSGDIFYCADYLQSTVTWNLALNIAAGGAPKKIVFDIFAPNNATFNLEGMILTDGINPKPVLFKNATATPFVVANMNQAVTWNTYDLTTFMSPLINYRDLTYDLVSPSSNATSRAFLMGQTIAGASVMAPVQLFNMQSQYYVSPGIVTYNTSGTAPNKNFKSVAVNYTAGIAIAVGDNGDLFKINGAAPLAGPIGYNDRSATVIPTKINEIQMVGGNLIVVGDEGYCAQKTFAPAAPFTMLPTYNTLNYKAFDTYNGGSNLFAVCDKGVLCNVTGINFAGSTNFILGTENLNDLCYGSVPNNPLIKHAYFVGDKASVTHLDLGNFNPASPVFTPLDMNTDVNINSLVFDAGSGMAICVGDKNQCFNLGGTSALQNPNWFTNEITQLHFTDADNGYLVGKKGLIKHTRDGGANWKTVRPFVLAASNQPIDLYSVYTTTQDTAVVGGAYSYLSNLLNLKLGNPLMPVLVANANYVVHDIDLANETMGFAVGTKYSAPIAATATLLTLNNNTVMVGGLTNLTGAGLGNLSFKSVYAFKGSQAGRFLAVGNAATLKYYNSTNFNATISWNPIGSSMFLSSDNINAVNFADNTDGYIGGVKTKLGSVRVNHSTNLVEIFEKNTAVTTDANNVGFTALNSISIVDNGGITAFMAGNVTFGGNLNNPAKYNWKFGEEKGRYSGQFWYDRLGRMAVSQNAEQSPTRYSYTRYDALGRIIEAGQKSENSTANTFATIFGTNVNNGLSANTIDDGKLQVWLNDNSGSRTEVTHTYYDKAVFDASSSCPLPNGFTQQNLRKRVASTTYEPIDDNNVCTYDYATHYSYDVHGNVKSLAQDNKKLSQTTSLNIPTSGIYHFYVITYDYDLISGKVNQIIYNGVNDDDKFYQDYTYDADNRLTEVRTSRNGLVWETDAKYFYYKHGPLARVEYGHDKVQGMDYAYTLQGWIKGVNSNKLVPANDIGQDATTGANSLFAQDAMGFTLGYYKSTDDYTPIQSSVWATGTKFEAFIGNSGTSSILYSNRNDLYNGNISSMATSISEPCTTYANSPPLSGFALNAKPMANAYYYDQLNRLTFARSFDNFRPANNDWLGTNTSIYNNSLSYDANGNIATQSKADKNNTPFDVLSYKYSMDAQGRPKNNRLNYVTDAITSPPPGNNDISHQTNTSNYVYDKIGNLKQDLSEGIGPLGGIVWTVYGKIKEVNHEPGSAKKQLKFDYDPQGNRIAKHVYDNSGTFEKSVYYVRDAQGNVLAVYENIVPGGYGPHPFNFKIKERIIYGSSRIGADRHDVQLANYGPVPPSNIFQRIVGKKHFELSNHLGNINAVVSDLKVPVPLTNSFNSTSIDHFVASIVSATDYYPFGQSMQGRDYSNANYRYGFNGKENDNEVKGGGNQQDYGMRIYDPRLGRFLSVDPLSKEYPELTPYQFASNCPIESTDLDGLEQLSKIVNHINVNDTKNGKGNLKDGDTWINPATKEVVKVGESIIVKSEHTAGSPFVQHNEIQYSVSSTGAVNITSRTFLQTATYSVVKNNSVTTFSSLFGKSGKEDAKNAISGIVQGLALNPLGENEFIESFNVNFNSSGLNAKEISIFKNQIRNQIKNTYNVPVTFTQNQSSQASGVTNLEEGQKVEDISNTKSRNGYEVTAKTLIIDKNSDKKE